MYVLHTHARAHHHVSHMRSSILRHISIRNTRRPEHGQRAARHKQTYTNDASEGPNKTSLSVVCNTYNTYVEVCWWYLCLGIKHAPTATHTALVYNICYSNSTHSLAWRTILFAANATPSAQSALLLCRSGEEVSPHPPLPLKHQTCNRIPSKPPRFQTTTIENICRRVVVAIRLHARLSSIRDGGRRTGYNADDVDNSERGGAFDVVHN